MKMTFATNMKCQSCLSKVAPVLDNAAKVKAWDADLASPNKLIRVDPTGDASNEEITALIESAGLAATPVEGMPAEPQGTAEPPDAGFRLSTYKPLFLVVAYVIGATAVAETAHGGFLWARAMSYFMRVVSRLLP